MLSNDGAGSKPNTLTLLQRIKASAYWRYRTVGWRWWWAEYRRTAWRSLREEVGMAIAGAVIAAASSIFNGYSSWDAIDWFNAARFGVIGGFATLLLFLFLSSLWRLLTAPHAIWAADQKKIEELQSACGELEPVKGSLEEERITVARLKQSNSDLAEDCRRLKMELESRRQLELIPRKVGESDWITVLPATIEYPDSERPDQEISVLWGSLANILIVNNDEHPTTIIRMWLRVCNPVTGEEVMPLSAEEMGPPTDEMMEPIERFGLMGPIDARGQTKGDLEFRAFYPGRLFPLAREERGRIITLCATASGLGTTCCALGEEFYHEGPDGE